MTTPINKNKISDSPVGVDELSPEGRDEESDKYTTNTGTRKPSLARTLFPQSDVTPVSPTTQAQPAPTPPPVPPSTTQVQPAPTPPPVPPPPTQQSNVNNLSTILSQLPNSPASENTKNTKPPSQSIKMDIASNIDDEFQQTVQFLVNASFGTSTPESISFIDFILNFHEIIFIMDLDRKLDLFKSLNEPVQPDEPRQSSNYQTPIRSNANNETNVPQTTRNSQLRGGNNDSREQQKTDAFLYSKSIVEAFHDFWNHKDCGDINKTILSTKKVLVQRNSNYFDSSAKSIESKLIQFAENMTTNSDYQYLQHVIENIEVSKRDKLQSYRIVHIDNDKTGTSSSSSRSSEKIKGDIQRLYRELKENGYIHTVRNNKEVFMCDLEFNPITKQDIINNDKVKYHYPDAGSIQDIIPIVNEYPIKKLNVAQYLDPFRSREEVVVDDVVDDVLLVKSNNNKLSEISKESLLKTFQNTFRRLGITIYSLEVKHVDEVVNVVLYLDVEQTNKIEIEMGYNTINNVCCNLTCDSTCTGEHYGCSVFGNLDTKTKNAIVLTSKMDGDSNQIEFMYNFQNALEQNSTNDIDVKQFYDTHIKDKLFLSTNDIPFFAHAIYRNIPCIITNTSVVKPTPIQPETVRKYWDLFFETPDLSDEDDEEIDFGENATINFKDNVAKIKEEIVKTTSNMNVMNYIRTSAKTITLYDLFGQMSQKDKALKIISISSQFSSNEYSEHNSKTEEELREILFNKYGPIYNLPDDFNLDVLYTSIITYIDLKNKFISHKQTSKNFMMSLINIKSILPPPGQQIANRTNQQKLVEKLNSHFNIYHEKVKAYTEYKDGRTDIYKNTNIIQEIENTNEFNKIYSQEPNVGEATNATRISRRKDDNPEWVINANILLDKIQSVIEEVNDPRTTNQQLVEKSPNTIFTGINKRKRTPNPPYSSSKRRPPIIDLTTPPPPLRTGGKQTRKNKQRYPKRTKRNKIKSKKTIKKRKQHKLNTKKKKN
jgi:hypothetical protein